MSLGEPVNCANCDRGFPQRTFGDNSAARVAELEAEVDHNHQPATYYELLLARLDGEPTDHGACRVAKELDRLEAELAKSKAENRELTMSQVRRYAAQMGDKIVAELEAALSQSKKACQELNTDNLRQEQRLSDLEADNARLRELLVEAQESVCSLLCPSKWPTGERPPHSALCNRITALAEGE